MKILVTDDDFVSRTLLQRILAEYGVVDVAVNGREAVAAVRAALADAEPYDLICLDVTMPVMGGQAALAEIRQMEEEAAPGAASRARVVMTTGRSDRDNVMKAIRAQCDGYIVKPYDKAGILEHLRKFGLIE